MAFVGLLPPAGDPTNAMRNFSSTLANGAVGLVPKFRRPIAVSGASAAYTLTTGQVYDASVFGLVVTSVANLVTLPTAANLFASINPAKTPAVNDYLPLMIANVSGSTTAVTEVGNTGNTTGNILNNATALFNLVWTNVTSGSYAYAIRAL